MSVYALHTLPLLLLALLNCHKFTSATWLIHWKDPGTALADEVDHRLATCQEENMYLNCKNRYSKLVIKDTFYGRKNNHTCASKIFDTDKICDETTPAHIKRKIDLMCTGESKCKVPVTPTFLERHGSHICPSVRKYLLVTYACHQNPKMHIVCPHNCTSKCWPLCQKDCCVPPVKVPEVRVAPTNRHCRDQCPDRCAPQCDMSCCASAYLRIPTNKPRFSMPVQNSCRGDCTNLCAPMCKYSCCQRHKKSSVHLPRLSQPGGGSAYTVSHSPDYVEPLSARLSCSSIMHGCNAKCAPTCRPECCKYMSYLQSSISSKAPLLRFTGRPATPVQTSGVVSASVPASPVYQAPVVTGYQRPIQAAGTVALPYYIGKPPTQSYAAPQPPPGALPTAIQTNTLAIACPASCRSTCESNCNLGCCVNPSTYVFDTPIVEDDKQRKTYELLLQKFRNTQLQKYQRQNTGQYPYQGYNQNTQLRTQ